ncbi:MAG: hypothetical protein JWM63_2899 [Gammaproteobacteria bacterium]|jgi:hypothetical protein|nr:hypothetical protein [Gammaproteobacteria bacterium]
MNASFKNLILCAHGALFVLGSSSLLAQDSGPPTVTDHEHSSLSKSYPSPLVDKVRRATARFRDINVAISEGWVQGTPCVSGPNSGAMGVHFVQPARIGDGVLNADEPEALIYEPVTGGGVRLVGVEFITLASAWASHNPGAGAPSLEGHLLNFVGEPNRYGLPAFYELHVWAWERNPNGSFADWNTVVSCDKQPGG